MILSDDLLSYIPHPWDAEILLVCKQSLLMMFLICLEYSYLKKIIHFQIIEIGFLIKFIYYIAWLVLGKGNIKKLLTSNFCLYAYILKLTTREKNNKCYVMSTSKTAQ